MGNDFQPQLFKDEEIPIGEMLSEKKAEELKKKIPLNKLATEDLIKELKGDDPVDCVFEVDYRQGSNGFYADSAYESIVEQIINGDPFIPSGYGHQSKEAYTYEGRQLYGTVIGALLDKENAKVYYRIIADKGDNAKDVRRWLKNKQINAVSIWGVPIYNDNETEIVDYKLRSIDFVPPHSEGQKNKAYIGEMEKSHEEIDRLLSKALNKKYADYVFIPEVYEKYFIASYDGNFYKISYKMSDEKVELGTAEKVRRIIKYEPMGVIKMGDMSNDALLAEIKARTSDGRLSAEKVAGEMGVKLENAELIKTLESAKLELEKFKETAQGLGLTLDELIDVVRNTKENERKDKERAEFEKSVNAVKEEKGLLKDGKATGEMASFIDKFARFEMGMTKEQIAGEMDRLINDPDIQKLVQDKFALKPLGSVSGVETDISESVITF